MNLNSLSEPSTSFSYNTANLISSHFMQLNSDPIEEQGSTLTSNLNATANMESSFSGFKPEMSNMIVGSVLSSANSSFNDINNSNLMFNARMGNSQYGHEFYAENAAQNLVNHNNTVNSIENTMIGVGSLFGPEGLAVGVAGAIAVGSVNAMMPDPTISINTTSGTPQNF